MALQNASARAGWTRNPSSCPSASLPPLSLLQAAYITMNAEEMVFSEANGSVVLSKGESVFELCLKNSSLIVKVGHEGGHHVGPKVFKGILGFIRFEKGPHSSGVRLAIRR